jgi:chromosome segregation ATPase
MTDETTPSTVDAHNALQALKDELESAYENAKTNDIRDQIDVRLDAIDPLLTALNQADMASRTVALSAAADSTEDALKKLQTLKEEVESIGDDIGKATQILNGVDQALSMVKTCFGV